MRSSAAARSAPEAAAAGAARVAAMHALICSVSNEVCHCPACCSLWDTCGWATPFVVLIVAFLLLGKLKRTRVLPRTAVLAYVRCF